MNASCDDWNDSKPDPSDGCDRHPDPHPAADDVRRRNAEWEAEADAGEWRRFQRHRRDLGVWLIDAATDGDGVVVKPRINAALGGESCVPGEFSVTANGKRYRIALVSTHYEVTET